jgi:ribosomal protein S16
MSYWIARGAQPSSTVRTLIARHLSAPAAVPAAAPPAGE